MTRIPGEDFGQLWVIFIFCCSCCFDVCVYCLFLDHDLLFVCHSKRWWQWHELTMAIIWQWQWLDDDNIWKISSRMIEWLKILCHWLNHDNYWQIMRCSWHGRHRITSAAFVILCNFFCFPGQLNRWPCLSLINWLTDFWIQRLQTAITSMTTMIANSSNRTQLRSEALEILLFAYEAVPSTGKQ